MSEKEARRAPVNTATGSGVAQVGCIAMATGDVDEAIRAQEAAGQRSLVGSDTLPTEIVCPDPYNGRAILEAAGVRFLGPVEGDALFQYVELPPGWRKVATDHSMWSKLVDEKGREHAGIFYKAAHYDRGAHLTLSKRFRVRLDNDRLNGKCTAVVMDGDVVVHTTEPIRISADEREDALKTYGVMSRAEAAAATWLDEHYPDWHNPGAYWDAEPAAGGNAQ